MSNSKTIDSTITAKDVASHSAGDVQVLKLLENQRKDARVLKRVQTDAGRLSSVHDQKKFIDLVFDPPCQSPRDAVLDCFIAELPTPKKQAFFLDSEVSVTLDSCRSSEDGNRQRVDVQSELNDPDLITSSPFVDDKDKYQLLIHNKAVGQICLEIERKSKGLHVGLRLSNKQSSAQVKSSLPAIQRALEKQLGVQIDLEILN